MKTVDIYDDLDKKCTYELNRMKEVLETKIKGSTYQSMLEYYYTSLDKVLNALTIKNLKK